MHGVYIPTGDLWLSHSAHDIIADMGFVLERGKINNLVSFGNGSIDLWSYLALMPKEHRAKHGEEWVNFILGPLAAALKLIKLDFDGRETVLHSGGAFMLLEAMALDLVPSGSRKALYEALLSRFNTEVASHTLVIPEGPYRPETHVMMVDEEDARLTFYTILADVLAPIFDEASADDLGDMIVKVLTENPKQATEAKDDPKVVGWIMGQVMRASPTKLDPNTVRAAIIERL